MKPLTHFEKMRNNRAMLEWHLQQQAQEEAKVELRRVRSDIWGEELHPALDGLAFEVPALSAFGQVK